MKVALLTTETVHHVYYARELHARHPLALVLLETAKPVHPFPTAHPFETLRDDYEKELLFGGRLPVFEEIAPVRRAVSVNDAETRAVLGALKPDVILVFGTGKLGAELIAIPSRACLNLHGGDPERYRGLDSHLWAILDGTFDALVTTLHHVDRDLDTGAIVAQETLPLTQQTRIEHLRAMNTSACLSLTVSALDLLRGGRTLPARPQTRRGRYFSAMPAERKEECVAIFRRHVTAL